MNAMDCIGFVNGGSLPLGIRAGRIVAAGGTAPAAVVDLDGDRLLPGLINAHDHLQLNNFPRLKFRDRYTEVGEWIADLEANRQTHRELADAAAVPRELRLRMGGLKNLLAGVTTVAHHDPLYPELLAADFPVRVLAGYGWSHSLGVTGIDAVIRSHRHTPATSPWFIHAGEGVSEAMAREFETLDNAGCLTANARLIHGVAFDEHSCRRLAARGAGLIWCPASNEFLFGRTLRCRDLIEGGSVALGSDSRLSGSRDLLEELQAAQRTGLVADEQLEPLVTRTAAKLLGLHDRGTLDPGSLADLLVLPGDLPLWRATRADVRCVMLGGRMLYGDSRYARQLMAPGEALAVTVDGRPKVLLAGLARLLPEAREPGVQQVLAGRAA
jgi:cytosine/adenosine deaminase-related metal-dependent hydrolase